MAYDASTVIGAARTACATVAGLQTMPYAVDVARYSRAKLPGWSVQYESNTSDTTDGRSFDTSPVMTTDLLRVRTCHHLGLAADREANEAAALDHMKALLVALTTPPMRVYKPRHVRTTYDYKAGGGEYLIQTMTVRCRRTYSLGPRTS